MIKKYAGFWVYAAILTVMFITIGFFGYEKSNEIARWLVFALFALLSLGSFGLGVALIILVWKKNKRAVRFQGVLENWEIDESDLQAPSDNNNECKAENHWKPFSFEKFYRQMNQAEENPDEENEIETQVQIRGKFVGQDDEKNPLILYFPFNYLAGMFPKNAAYDNYVGQKFTFWFDPVAHTIMNEFTGRKPRLFNTLTLWAFGVGLFFGVLAYFTSF